MKKLFILLALSAICTGALAQDLDLDINQISLSREDAAVEAELEFALPMYFGLTKDELTQTVTAIRQFFE